MSWLCFSRSAGRLPPEIGCAEAAASLGSHLAQRAEKQPAHALYDALHKTVRPQLIKGTVCYLVQACGTLFTPLIIFELLKWMEDPSIGQHYGYIMICCLAVTTILFAFGNQWYILQCDGAGLRSRAALCSAAYRKTLTTSLDDMGGSSIGELTALMHSDSSSLLPFWHAYIGLWLLPVEVVSCI